MVPMTNIIMVMEQATFQLPEVGEDVRLLHVVVTGLNLPGAIRQIMLMAEGAVEAGGAVAVADIMKAIPWAVAVAVPVILAVQAFQVLLPYRDFICSHLK